MLHRDKLSKLSKVNKNFQQDKQKDDCKKDLANETKLIKSNTTIKQKYNNKKTLEMQKTSN